MSSSVETAGAAGMGARPAEMPAIPLPQAPAAGLLWSRGLTVASILVTLFTLDVITVLFSDYWLFESLGLTDIFWTNFRMGAVLYVAAFAAFAAAIAAPAVLHDVGPRSRRFVVQAAFLVASVAAYLAATNYSEFLLGGKGFTFDETDPVFGRDIGFYAFDLPNIWIAWRYLTWAAFAFLAVSVACANASRARRSVTIPTAGLRARLATSATRTVRAAWILLGILVAAGIWLTRYDLLLKNNSDAATIKRGAQYLDVVGFFSNLTYITVTTLVVLGFTLAIASLLKQLHDPTRRRSRERLVLAGKIAVALVVADFAFKSAVVIRYWIFVKPNEPVIQIPYITRHVDATRRAYGLEGVHEIDFLPNRPGDPVPTAESILASPTIQNAPLWPGFTSYLERWIDRQHAQRILQTGNAMVYGPTLELFQQQQKLRTYYNFLNVDTVRYRIGGQERMFVSAVRETPLYEPVPWLAYWGQRFMMFTHGFGLVLAPAASVTADGEPTYVSWDIPAKVTYPELAVAEPRVYYGEGSSTMAFSNVHGMKELDYPTDQDRAEIVLPESEKTGIHIDSLWKRVVLGWRSGKFWELVFSDLITPGTRAHYIRTPVDRLARIAPFLFYDSNPYAVAVDGRIVWIVNAMTTTDRYPYSLIEELGDKSDERSPFPRPTRWINYVEDSIKATVDAATGQIKFYKIHDGPVARAWEKVYPTLFSPGEKMPEAVRAQLTYPPQLLHIQFDDLYIYYHMKDPMYFFNMEDMWDDGDEVLGPILDTGKAITFSMEPYACMLEPGNGVLPPSGARQNVQYSLAMVFTPEKALNLRGIPIVYQDPPDYGKISVLQIPKGQYVIGPEQADAAIDQDPVISQSISWWNRKGTEVIRGHTTLLPVGKEVLYVEPIFLRSQQNFLPQMKKVIVVMRGKPFMSDTLEQAVRDAVAFHQAAGAPAANPKATRDGSRSAS